MNLPGNVNYIALKLNQNEEFFCGARESLHKKLNNHKDTPNLIRQALQ